MGKSAGQKAREYAAVKCKGLIAQRHSGTKKTTRLQDCPDASVGISSCFAVLNKTARLHDKTKKDENQTHTDSKPG